MFLRALITIDPLLLVMSHNKIYFFSISASKIVLREVGRQIIQDNQDSDEDEDKELIQFDHACIQCNHIIAKHLHEFWVEEGYQEYQMKCALCGVAQDSISVMPKDPKKMVSSF